MSLALSRRCLILNADYRPLGTHPLSVVSAEEAIKIIIRNRASVVEEWDEVLRSPSITMHVPRVLALHEYASVGSEPKFCRRSVLLRDHYRCQYCGHQFDSADLTFDHVIPRAKGGETRWDNILMCCVPCNSKKQALHANWSGKKGQGLRPLKAPRQPSTMELLRAGLDFIDPVTKQTWHDWLYWSSELHA